MATGFSVFVDIGAKVGGSIGSSIKSVESQFAGLSRKLKTRALETKLAFKEMQSTSHAFGAAIAGIGIGHGIKAVLGDGAEYQHEIFALRNAGRTVTEVAEGIKKAHEVVGSLPTSTFTDNLKLLNETTGAFGDFHHAVENLDFNAKLGSMMKASFGDKMGDQGTAFNDLVRAFEIRGTANNPAVYQKEVGELYKSMVFTKGNVNPNEFLHFAQQANPAIKNLSERFLTRIAPSLIQELGGDRAGTSLTAFRGTIMGKARDEKQAAMWMKAGLLDPKQAIMKGNKALGWNAGAIKGTDLALSDPLKWAETIGIPAMQKLGVDINDQLQVSKTLGTMFRNTNANRFAEAMFQVRDRQRLHKDEDRINEVPGFEKQYDASLRNITTAVDAVHHSFQNLFAALSAPLLEPAANALTALARGVNHVAVALAEHPMLGGGLGIAGGILAGVAGLKAMQATLGMLGLAGIGPLRLMKALLFDIGAMAAGAIAAGLRGLIGVVEALLNPMRALAFAAGMARSMLLFTGVGIALAGLVTAGTFIANNWEGLGRFFTAFGESVKAALGPETVAKFQPLIDAGSRILSVFQSVTAEISPDKWSAWGTAAGVAVGQAIQAILDLPNKVAAMGAAFGAAMTSLAQSGYNSVLAVDWTGLGSAIVESIIAGIGSMGAALGNKLGALASEAAGRVKGILTLDNTAIRTEGNLLRRQDERPAGRRALGGSVLRGRSYLVGERGPELFMPSGSGRIETNGAVNRLMAARRGGGPVTNVSHGPMTVNVSVQAGSGDPHEIARVARSTFQNELRRMQADQRGLLSD